MSKSDGALVPLTSNSLSDQCRICGGSARYSYFGVVACHPCKMFFKRNAENRQPWFKCDSNNQCEITINTRHKCPSCRLVKCFRSGMSTDKFRARQSRKWTKTRSLIATQQLPTLNLLRSDSSLLSTAQRTLLSCLLNSYQESNLLSIAQRLTQIPDALQSMNVTYAALLQEFFSCIYETTGESLRRNRDLCSLPSNDRSIMLHNAAHSISSMFGVFVMHKTNLFSFDHYSTAVEQVYGKEIVDVHRWGTKFVLQDLTLVKLAMSLFAMSESISSYSPNTINTFTDPLPIFEIQNKYAEVTWKYLLYKYGEREAVNGFLHLTSWLLAMSILIFHIRTLKNHVNNVNSLVEQTELSLIMEDDDDDQSNKTSE